MGIEDDLERRLDNWARWYWGAGPGIGSAGIASIYRYAQQSRRYSEVPMPIINGEALETDTAHWLIEAELRAALRARYLRLAQNGLTNKPYTLWSSSEIQVASALYISYNTYLRHVDKAKAALMAQIQSMRGRRRVEV